MEKVAEERVSKIHQPAFMKYNVQFFCALSAIVVMLHRL